MTNAFGKELRKLRIDETEMMKDMAERIGVSSAFLSAIERDKKPLPPEFEERVVAAYRLEGEQAKAIRTAADISRQSFVFRPESALARDAAGVFARKVNSLSEDQIRQMLEVMKGK